jgi:signal transduction histidine kinase
MLTLEDSGPGIKREHLNHLFDSFFTTKDVGIGLGLRISRSIVEGHGGCIGADDESAVWRRSFQLHIAGEAALAGRAPGEDRRMLAIARSIAAPACSPIPGMTLALKIGAPIFFARASAPGHRK